MRLLGFLTVVIIVGGVIFGIFTATESAAIAVIYAFLVAMFAYRELKWGQSFPSSWAAWFRTVAMVMILIGFASAFAYMMTLMQIPAKVTDFFLTLSDNKIIIMMMINIMLLVLGMFMDMAPLILICTPILASGDQVDRRRSLCISASSSCSTWASAW